MALNKKQLKVLEHLERRVEMCREFMNDWLLFNQIISAYPKQETNKAQLESQFLKIKSKLAREHRVLKDTLQTDYAIDGGIMNIISSATSLENIYGQSEVAIKKIQTEWHRAFISINETLGVIDDKRARAEAGEKIFIVIPGEAVGGGGMSDKNKKMLLVLVILGVVIGLVMFAPFPPFPTIRDTYMGFLK